MGSQNRHSLARRLGTRSASWRKTLGLVASALSLLVALFGVGVGGAAAQTPPSPDIVPTSLQLLTPDTQYTVTKALPDTDYVLGTEAIAYGSFGSGWADTVYLSTDQTVDAGDVVLASHGISPKPSDFSYGISSTIKFPHVPAGDYYLIYFADSGGDQAEVNEANNLIVKALPVGGPDLSSTFVKAYGWDSSYTYVAVSSLQPGQQYEIAWDIHQSGDMPAPAPWHDTVYLSSDQTIDDSDLVLVDFTHDSSALTADGVYSTDWLTMPWVGVQPGPHYLLSKVDSGNAITETNENNNVQSLAVDVVMPDLKPNSLQIGVKDGTATPPSFTPTTSLERGGTYTAVWQAGNVAGSYGVGTSSGWYDRVFLSTDNTLSADDVSLGQVAAQYSPPLKPGDSYSGELSVTIPASIPGGNYYLLVKTDDVRHADGSSDYWGAVPERNETNNVATYAVTVMNAKPIAEAGGPYNVNEGETVTLTGVGTDPDDAPGALTFAWDLDNDGTYEQAGSSVSFSAASIDGPASRTVGLKVCDPAAACDTDTATINVVNVAPTITSVTNSGPVNPGSAVKVTVNATDPAGAADPLTFEFDCNNDGTYEANTGSTNSTSCSFAGVAAGSHTVSVRVTDDDGGTTTGSTTVTVNAKPTAEAGGPYSVDEGGSVTLTAVASDPDGTAGGLTVAWDLDLDGVYETVGSSVTFSAAGIDGPASKTVGLQACDTLAACGTDTATINIANAAPTISSATNNGPVYEGSAVKVTVNATDPAGAADPLTYEFDCNNDGTYEINAGSTNSASCTFADEGTGTYTVGVRVGDDDGATTTGSSVVTVKNAAPVITSTTGPAAPLTLGSTASVSVAFTDAGVNDTQTCSFYWNGTGSAPDKIAPTGGSCTSTHIYGATGVYSVPVSVTDNDNGTGTAQFDYVVVYNPTGGYVAGHGWINSPLGAYPADQTLGGRATFGFVSKYDKGATLPTGDTEFLFKAAGFDFTSTSYEWLVVAGAKGQFKGSGTVNGTGNYGFLLTATDGNVDGTMVDKFRIKIWDKGTGAVVYDNQLGADDTSAPSTAVNGGKIIVHKAA